MPTYVFRCDAGCQFDAFYTMAEVPRQAPCAQCGAAAVRIVTTPHLGRSGTSAYRAIEQSERTAHAPEVTTSIPSAPRKSTPVTTNPLHARLPRP